MEHVFIVLTFRNKHHTQCSVTISDCEYHVFALDLIPAT